MYNDIAYLENGESGEYVCYYLGDTINVFVLSMVRDFLFLLLDRLGSNLVSANSFFDFSFRALS
jgi:hypothetical protein